MNQFVIILVSKFNCNRF